MFKFVTVCAFMLGVSSFAQANEMHGNGPCKADREKLCAGVEHGKGAMMKCMKDNEAQLSAECKAHIETMKGAMKEVKEACHDDYEKFCGNEKPGHGRIMKCLKKHKDELSQACKDEMGAMKEMRKKMKKGS
ncbi:cysteine rich repeat-containing protein [Bdellovibrio sp. 22V]|uniref:cysteine rich repeat-containing protein n=1 Tax=Bdellovibrio TaxID=958 RepID=UPI002543A557|nr:cysteine rich repeat-containing protein [Bdellovibrio sp. 22V]WII71793.1 cysteine rich repeat-containing protein [Bdellovibrio sp. 22V]